MQRVKTRGQIRKSLQGVCGARWTDTGPCRLLCGVLFLILGPGAVPCFGQSTPDRTLLNRTTFGSSTGVAPAVTSRLAPRVAVPDRSSRLRVQLAEFLDLLERYSKVESYREQLGPTVRVSHQLAAYRFELPVRGRSPLEISASLGLGATTFRSDRIGGLLATPIADTETQIALRGGVSLEYRLGAAIDVFAGCQSYFDIADVDDRKLANRLGGQGDLDDLAWWRFPVHWGVQVRLP